MVGIDADDSNFIKVHAGFVAPLVDLMLLGVAKSNLGYECLKAKIQNKPLDQSIKVTNGKTEGYNNKAKVVKRRSYGFRNFNNYRLRLLSACS